MGREGRGGGEREEGGGEVRERREGGGEREEGGGR